jgi:hypothetical protein
LGHVFYKKWAKTEENKRFLGKNPGNFICPCSISTVTDILSYKSKAQNRIILGLTARGREV